MAGPASVEGSTDLPPDIVVLCTRAERRPRWAVSLARRRHARAAGLSPQSQALAAYALGYALLCWERLGEAEAPLADAYARLQQLGEARATLHVRRALLLLAILQGRNTDDIAEWTTLATRYAELGDPLSAARALLGQMGRHNMQERPQEALELVGAIRPVFVRLGAAGDHAWLDRLSGAAYLNRGQLDSAWSAIEAAMAQFAALRAHVELVKTLIERARLHEFRGDFAQVERDLEQCRHMAIQLDLPFRIAICLKNLGCAIAYRGQYDRGIQLSLQAYDQLAALGRWDRMADCDLNLGNVTYFAGLYDLALAAYRRAELIYTTHDQQRMSLVSRRNQALVLRQQRLVPAALAILAELEPLAEQLGERLELAAIAHARGQILGDMGQLDDALEVLAAAAARFDHLQSASGAAMCRMDRGWLFLQRGAVAEAEACFQAALPPFEEQLIQRWQIDYGLGRCADLREQWDAAMVLYRKACLTVAQLRQRLANEHASSGLFTQAGELVDHAINLAWRLRDAEAILEFGELQRSLALVAQLRAAQVRSFAEGIPSPPRTAGPHAAGAPGALDTGFQQSLQAYLEQRLRNRHIRPIDDHEVVEPLDLPHLRAAFDQAFPEGWALLAYLLWRDQLLIVTMDAAALMVEAIPVDRQLRHLLEQATLPRYRRFTYLDDATRTATGAATWRVLRELGDRLIPARLRKRMRPEARLLIVPGGPLHGLPWAALRPDGRWLVEQAIPQLLPGLLSWPQLALRRPQRSDGLLVGVSKFDGRVPDLNGVRLTLDLVADRWPGAVTRLEEQEVQAADLLERAARGDLQQYGLLHICTHGKLNTASGLLAHLKLSTEDLFYDEITQLRLEGALVVLAACEGAAGEWLHGEEILSLSRAFLIAGARDVIASEWQLHDNAAPLFLALLYEELAAGLDAPTALAQAQRRWLQQPADATDLGPLAGAPYIWSGLTALGAGTLPSGSVESAIDTCAVRAAAAVV